MEQFEELFSTFELAVEDLQWQMECGYTKDIDEAAQKLDKDREAVNDFVQKLHNRIAELETEVKKLEGGFFDYEKEFLSHLF